MMINGKYYTETEAAAFIQLLLHILSDARSVITPAFYANYHIQNKADAVVVRIDAALRQGEKK